MRGILGRVQWHYVTAAEVQGYTVSRAEGAPDWELTATITAANRFRLSQWPLMFVAPTTRGAFRWAIDVDSLRLEQNILTARCRAEEGHVSIRPT